MKYKIILVDACFSDSSEVDFVFNTWDETVEKAHFFMEQGYIIQIQEILEEE